jgi:hypothetical protein
MNQRFYVSDNRKGIHMAEAKKITKEVMKSVKEDHIVLEMDMKEARVLRALLGACRTKGSPSGELSYRMYSKLQDQLLKMGDCQMVSSTTYFDQTPIWRVDANIG